MTGSAHQLICRRELVVGGGRDSSDAYAEAVGQKARREYDESHQQCVFDEILTLLVVDEADDFSHCPILADFCTTK